MKILIVRRFIKIAIFKSGSKKRGWDGSKAINFSYSVTLILYLCIFSFCSKPIVQVPSKTPPLLPTANNNNEYISGMLKRTNPTEEKPLLNHESSV